MLSGINFIKNIVANTQGLEANTQKLKELVKI